MNRRLDSAIGSLALLVLATACGAAALPAGLHATGEATPMASPSAPQAPAAGPSPQTRSSGVFVATVAHAPGARVRYGPGLDMPVMNIDPVGRTETFDGWFRRSDDQPLPDEATGQVEPWSRDWFHLADGRGWVHSSSVSGFQPAGMGQVAWRPPGTVPSATAGLIEIALHLQQHPVTCEVASLQMALSGRGIQTDEQSLLGLTGMDPRPAVDDGSGNIQRWGDPNQAFVGSPDGHVLDHTGYGVYAAPIARAAERAGASVLASGDGIAPSAIYGAVIAGHPAITWVTNDYRRASLQTWRAWDGSTVQYALTEHAVLVVGVTPTSVLVNDPWWGQTWHSRNEFEAAYATFGGMAVVVR